MKEDTEHEQERVQRGIQSIEIGGQLLRALVHQGRTMALKDLAREAEMTTAKAHPYLVSLGRIGLVQQDPESGRYGLGPLALQLGLIGMQQFSPVRIATPVVDELTQRIGHTAAVAVWGTRGATIVHVAESPAALHVSMRHGTVFSLTQSATGRIFSAYLPEAIVQESLRDTQQRLARHPTPALAGMPAWQPEPTWAQFQQQLQQVRERSMSRSEEEIVPGVNAMSAPVFNYDGTIALAVTVIGHASMLDVSWDGAVAQALRAAIADIAARLGRPTPGVRTKT